VIERRADLGAGGGRRIEADDQFRADAQRWHAGLGNAGAAGKFMQAAERARVTPDVDHNHPQFRTLASQFADEGLGGIAMGAAFPDEDFDFGRGGRACRRDDVTQR